MGGDPKGTVLPSRDRPRCGRRPDLAGKAVHTGWEVGCVAGRQRVTLLRAEV